MTRHVALLRGVNLAGRNRVAMKDLRAVVESLGHTDVVTYINSGNVVFTSGSPTASNAELAAAIEERLAAELDLRVAVLVRSADELADVLAANPFPDADPPRLLITFANEPPSDDVMAKATSTQSGNDEVEVRGTTTYLHCPDGIGRSKLAALLSKQAMLAGTARNLATVRKLLDLARRQERAD
jgi:uncharacterized protein (DUF1697 family)